MGGGEDEGMLSGSGSAGMGVEVQDMMGCSNSDDTNGNQGAKARVQTDRQTDRLTILGSDKNGMTQSCIRSPRRMIARESRAGLKSP